jgi:hypothetical protein
MMPRQELEISEQKTQAATPLYELDAERRGGWMLCAAWVTLGWVGVGWGVIVSRRGLLVGEDGDAQ